MEFLASIRRLPPPVRLGAPVLAVVLAAGAAGALLVDHPKSGRSALKPSPAPTELVSPSPSPSQSPSPSPSPEPSVAVAPAPARSLASGCAPPHGGFPGSQLPASTPVALAWSPDGRLFWAERAGRVRVYEGGAVQTFASVPTVNSEQDGSYSERGLLGLAISGTYVFAFYSNADYATQTIIRWTDCGGAATNPTIIAGGLPAGPDCCHKGGRLAVSPDGHLFATIGDNHAASAAQAPGDLRGKVLRFNLDGGGRTIWTSGLRNPFGIAFSPDGTLAVTNNGPSRDAGTPCGACGDEFDLVGRGPGVTYEWPTCWGYDHAFGANSSCRGLGPGYSTEGGPSPQSTPYFVAPSGAAWSSGAFAGHFVFCAYSTGSLYEYLGPRSVIATGLTGCRYDVKQGPDGALYTSSDGAIYRH